MSGVQRVRLYAVPEVPTPQVPLQEMMNYIDKAEPPPSLMTGPSPPGAMSGREALERVLTGLPFLIWIFELEHSAEH